MALWRDFNRTVGSGIVRPGIFSLMVLMDENPGIAQIELATQLAIDKATVVGLIRRLLREGWIEGRQSPTDRRRQDLYLTPPADRSWHPPPRYAGARGPFHRPVHPPGVDPVRRIPARIQI